MKNLREEIEFLEFIYQNAQISKDTVLRIIGLRDKDDEINSLLKEILDKYRKIIEASKSMIERRNKKAEDIGVVSKIATYMSIKMNMNKDESIAETAKILIQGSTMVVESITLKLKDYNIDNKNVINLAERFIEFEKENINRFKMYL